MVGAINVSSHGYIGCLRCVDHGLVCCRLLVDLLGELRRLSLRLVALSAI